MATAAELSYDTGATAQQMADEIFGDGMTVVTAAYAGDPLASGTYAGGDTLAPGATPSDGGVILSTGRVASFTNSSGDPNIATKTTTNTDGVDRDPLLDEVAGMATFDGAILAVDFVPTGDTLTMQFVFSSEEYLEYVNSGFNDTFAVWVNGQLMALAVGSGDVSIDNINDSANQNLFIDNRTDALNSEMDGVTLTLSMKAPLNAGAVNTLRIGIADGGDASYDSNLLIAANSVQSVTIAQDDSIVMAQGVTRTLDVLANDSTQNGALTITHINGQPVVAGQPVTLTSGEVVTLTPDGKLQIAGDGDTGTESFTYTVTDGTGTTDIGMVEVTESTIPCFAAGTLIDTETGPCAVEALRPGQMVRTRRGPQPVRWVGSVLARRAGAHAPVVIDPGVLGNDRALVLSPLHRVRVASPRAALLFQSPAVLVAARDLVNGHTVRRDTSGGPIRYVHVLFDRHEVLRANGVWAESYHPGDCTLGTFDASALAELLDLFPQLSRDPRAYGPTTLPVLKPHEARLLLAGQAPGVR